MNETDFCSVKLFHVPSDKNSLQLINVGSRLFHFVLIVLMVTTLKFYRKIHYLTREFRVKLHAKTDIARMAKR